MSKPHAYLRLNLAMTEGAAERLQEIRTLTGDKNNAAVVRRALAVLEFFAEMAESTGGALTLRPADGGAEVDLGDLREILGLDGGVLE